MSSSHDRYSLAAKLFILAYCLMYSDIFSDSETMKNKRDRFPGLNGASSARI